MHSQRRAVSEAVTSWIADQRATALATVVSSSDSAPRGLGAQLAISRDSSGEMVWVGGLTGGCAESAVLEAALQLFAADTPRGAVKLELQKDALGSVGPVCGALLGVVVELADEDLAQHLAALVAAGKRGVGASTERTYLALDAGPEYSKYMRTGIAHSEEPLPRGRIGTVTIDGDRELTIRESIPQAPQLVVCGAGDTADELIATMAQLGWRTVLIDPRAAFLEHTLQHVTPDVSMCAWPQDSFDELGVDSATACITLAHDEKIDMPFLERALQSPALYVGSVGSRVTQAERNRHLRTLVGEEAVERHHGPAGLNLGGSTAAEIAVSIAAELVATWYERSAQPLVGTTETIRAR
jgi:xanthine dehydrogenase accessory factor